MFWLTDNVRHRNEGYDKFAEALREIDKQDDVLVTVWQGKQKLFLSKVPDSNLEMFSYRKVVLRVSLRSHPGSWLK